MTSLYLAQLSCAAVLAHHAAAPSQQAGCVSPLKARVAPDACLKLDVCCAGSWCWQVGCLSNNVACTVCVTTNICVFVYSLAAVFSHTTNWLPVTLVDDLNSFLSSPNSPGAICISGLPLDTDIPPTPSPLAGLQVAGKTHTVSGSQHRCRINPAGPEVSIQWNGNGAQQGVHSKQQQASRAAAVHQSVLPARDQQPTAGLLYQPWLPVAESVVLSIAKCLGDPFTFHCKSHKSRGGLLTDLTPTGRQDYKHKTRLCFHQVMPARLLQCGAHCHYSVILVEDRL